MIVTFVAIISIISTLIILTYSVREFVLINKQKGKLDVKKIKFDNNINNIDHRYIYIMSSIFSLIIFIFSVYYLLENIM